MRQVFFEARLVPCSRDKKPLIADWVHRASSDPAQHTAWEAEFPGCLWGILCGEVFDVLDVDPIGLEWALAHESELGTWTQRTKRRALHLYFLATPGLTPRTDCPVRGVDVRATGSIVIDWKRQGYPTIERAMLPMPGWLVELVRPTGNAPTTCTRLGLESSSYPNRAQGVGEERTVDLARRTERILRKVELAQRGNRNAMLFWASCRFAEIVSEGRLKREVAEQLLRSAARVNGLVRDDGEGQVTATIASGFRKVAGTFNRGRRHGYASAESAAAE